MISDYFKAIFLNNTFVGRASRWEYWEFTILNWLIGSGFWLFSDGKPIILPRSDTEPYHIIFIGLFILIFLFSVLLWFAQWTIKVRRLHDTGRSGWNLLWEIIPIFGSIGVFLMLIEKGSERENSYGPSKSSKTLDPEK
jgi:uncharacterized membrane protein YhaH (DUF805 family)